MKYRPEIDGLRSFAVLPVILFHGGLTIFSGGYVGVDVFFVISGYLITTIILDRIEAGSFSILDFYSRRARRILPALALVVAASFPFAWLLMLPSDFKDFAQSVAAVSIFSSNILFWIESDYFAAASELKPLLHTWSLAVEEQYYVFFPLLMWAVWPRSRRIGIALPIVIFVLSLALAEYGWRNWPDANFYLLPARAWELMAGSLCAIALLRSGPRANEAGAFLGLVLVIVPVFVYDKTTPFPSLYALVPVLGTSLIILFAAQGTLVARLLSMKVFVAIGLISYSAYLWHQPLFSFARIASPVEPPLWVMMILAVLSLILAGISWRYVERPFRTGSWSKGRVVIATTIGSLVVFAFAALLSVMPWQQNAFMARLSPENRQVLAQITRMKTMDHYASVDDGPCRFYLDDYNAETDARFDQCVSEHGPALVIFGDSHSIDVYKGVVANSDLPFVVGVPQDACRPHVEGNACENSDLERFLIRHAEGIGQAFYVQAGFWLLTDADGTEHARLLFTMPDDLDPRLNMPAIDRAMAFLEDLSTQISVTWVGPRVEPHVGEETLLGRDCSTAPGLMELRPAHEQIFHDLDVALATRTAAAEIGYVSTVEAMQFDIQEDLYTCDVLYWSDGDHWSPEGEIRFGARLTPAISEAFTRGRSAAGNQHDG